MSFSILSIFYYLCSVYWYFCFILCRVIRCSISCFFTDFIFYRIISFFVSVTVFYCLYLKYLFHLFFTLVNILLSTPNVSYLTLSLYVHISYITKHSTTILLIFIGPLSCINLIRRNLLCFYQIVFFFLLLSNRFLFLSARVPLNW